MKAPNSSHKLDRQRLRPNPSAAQRLVRSYLTSLGIVALVSVVGLALNLVALHRQEQGARALSLTGRQRTLGQKIALDALAVQAAETTDERTARANELQTDMITWEMDQEALTHCASGPLARLVTSAAASRQATADAAKELLAALPPEGDAARPNLYAYLTPLLHNEVDYAAEMAPAVAEAHREAHDQRAYLARAEWGLLAAVLLTLLAEAALAIGPARSGVRRAILDLHESEEKIAGQDAALGEADRQIAEMRAVLQNLATVDALTGLKNHREFHEQLDRELGRSLRHGRPLSLMLVDVDKFKSYNETYGHSDGDEALKLIGRVLKESARATDIPARYGGEEFAVILTETDTMGAAILGERLRHAVAEADCLQRPLTVSVGIATLTPGTFGVAGLVAQADRALCHAKGEGRNRVTHASRLPDPVEENWRFTAEGELVTA